MNPTNGVIRANRTLALPVLEKLTDLAQTQQGALLDPVLRQGPHFG